MQHEVGCDRKKAVLQLARSTGVLRPRDVEAAGIPREYLLRLLREGLLVRTGRGLYSLPDMIASESATLADVAKRVPNGVVCLISALTFHQLTTQVSDRVWVAIERRTWEPRLVYPTLELVRMGSRSFTYGVEQHEIDRTTVRIYSPAKTVADCFKFRNRIGLDVALESLRATWRERRATMDEMWEAAAVCRVANVMRPYLESIA
jgi:predicted transcriptional regulator of viral defense system